MWRLGRHVGAVGARAALAATVGVAARTAYAEEAAPNTAIGRTAYAEEAAPSTAIGGDEVDEWEVEKEKCSFCRAFLKSPCKLPFKNWSICVDKAKAEEADFVKVCSEYTGALLECTSTHSEFFTDLDKNDEEEGEDEAESEAEAETEAEAKPREAEAIDDRAKGEEEAKKS